MGLSDFITLEVDKIMSEFESFARQQLPAAADMNVAALRDHARQVLETIALDMRQPQSSFQQRQKSLGKAPRIDSVDSSPAEIHGTLRAEAGFDVNQTAAEYRALRASVIRLWMESAPTLGRAEVIELTRFNEAMDEALAASILHFAAEAARMRNLFLGVLSHELRTPLSTIMASGESLLVAARAGKVIPQAAERSLRGAHRIKSLLDDLLDYVRSGLGEGMRVTAAPDDLRQICTRVVGELLANHPVRVIDVQTAGDTSCACDGQRVAQSISNLLGNALRHGSPDMPVTVKVDGLSTDMVTISVHNNGSVIPNDTRETLFEPLVRGAGAVGGGYNLGLGLYVVREIAFAHGGTVDVQSDDKTGTVFSIQLPRDGAAAAASAFPGMRMS